MLSNFGNLLLFLNTVISVTIVYSSYKCLKIPGNLITKNISK